MHLGKFYNYEYSNYSLYTTLRMMASAIDGLKNSHRKILCTLLLKNINTEIKVSQLDSKMAETTEYLHGSASSAIVTMAQNFAGTNNLPLLARSGNFGTRFTPEASAPRYIYTYKEKYVDQLFKKDDEAILVKQIFEGNEIEPQFYVPTLPMLVINGSEGVATGFAQKILSRNVKDVEKYISGILKGKSRKFMELIPYFNGFNGLVERGENEAQWIVKGVLSKTSVAKVTVTELPINVSYKDYIKTLDELEDKGVIKSYNDKCDNDVFNFEVSMDSKIIKELSEDELLQKLKLIKKITENYTSIDENNKVRQFKDIYGIVDYFISVKLKYTNLRKQHIINTISSDISQLQSKYNFIKAVLDNKLIINKRSKQDIVSDLEKMKDIITVDDNYDYLLRMPIYSLTDEKVKELQESISKKELELTTIKSKTETDLWLEDISVLKF